MTPAPTAALVHVRCREVIYLGLSSLGQELEIASADCSWKLLEEETEQAWGSSENMWISNVRWATELAMASREAIPRDMVYAFSTGRVAGGG